MSEEQTGQLFCTQTFGKQPVFWSMSHSCLPLYLMIQSPEPILNYYSDQQFPDVVSKPTTSVLAENLVGMQILRLYPRPTEPETVGMRSSNLF